MHLHNKNHGLPGRSLSTRSLFAYRRWTRTAGADPETVDSNNAHPSITPKEPSSSPYNLPYQANLSSSVIRAALPALNRAARKSADRLSGRWDKSTTRLPAWEAICDDLFAPAHKLELKLDFETEFKATPPYDQLPVATGRSSALALRGSGGLVAAAAAGAAGGGKKLRGGKRRRILRNIPTVKGGFWNLCFRRVPKIQFIRRFEDSE